MPLGKLLTGSATARIIDILWENHGTDLTLTELEIRRNLDVGC